MNGMAIHSSCACSVHTGLQAGAATQAGSMLPETPATLLPAKKQLTHRLASPWIETLVLRRLSFAWTVTATILEALTPSKNLVQGKAADPTVVAPFGDPV